MTACLQIKAQPRSCPGRSERAWLAASEPRANERYWRFGSAGARRPGICSKKAAVLGLSQPSVSSRLKGDVAWDVDELAKVASWLDVPLAELIASAA